MVVVVVVVVKVGRMNQLTKTTPGKWRDLPYKIRCIITTILPMSRIEDCKQQKTNVGH